MADPAMGAQRGMTRRDMIKASALAGAAAWTAPVIIDSVASPAAAQTPTVENTGINCSKSILFFTIPGDTTVYIAGFQDNACQTCNCFGNWSSPNLGNCNSACFTCGGVTYQVNAGSGTSAGTATSCGGTFTQASILPFGNATDCNHWLSYGGGTVTGINGATVLGALGFGGNQLNGYCPSGNQVTNLGACNTAGAGNTTVSFAGCSP